ncbi:hypothetical protein [Nocardia wallacei]|uniref:hypothetical protein n=1 Tax=Nocardia wallacei TaxID=480035 RepID=UPI002454AFF6|nr:hypothetical protein [Nocardia wallacei]
MRSGQSLLINGAGGEVGGYAVQRPDGPDGDVRVRQVLVSSDATQLAALVDAGLPRIDVAQRRPLTDLATVDDDAVSGQLPGQTVLVPCPVPTAP